jgi:GAF domain-containing protein
MHAGVNGRSRPSSARYPTSRGEIIRACFGQRRSVVLEGKAVHVVDTKADPEMRLTVGSGFANVRTVLGVPMLREGTPTGVLVLTRSTVEPFTDKQIELVTTFADQAVIAIENVRLFDVVQARTRELSEALEQQTATSEVLQVISSSPGELEPVFQAMLANATRQVRRDLPTPARQNPGDRHGRPPSTACGIPARSRLVRTTTRQHARLVGAHP